MTATNKCYNFVGFRCRLPLNCAVYGVYMVLRNYTAVSSMKQSNPVKIFCLIILKS